MDATRRELITSIKIINVTHLLFMDGVLLISNGNDKEASLLLRILYIYGIATSI